MIGSAFRGIGDVLAVAALEEKDNDMMGQAHSDDQFLFSQTNDAFDILQLVRPSRSLVDTERAIKSRCLLLMLFDTHYRTHDSVI